jgi:dTDP-glucose 4,6-dehydratase
VLVEAARSLGVGRYVQVSTDEVYGSLGATGTFREDTPLAPNSPYSASKAAADLLVRAYVHTHGLPAVVTRCSNNYGPWQFPEKLIPLFVTNLIEGRKVPVYGDGQQVRDWIHVSDHCRAIRRVAEAGRVGEVYNAGGECEQPNLAITERIITLVGADRSMIEYVKDRPGHDRRYAIDCTRMKTELGWRPLVNFETGLAETVQWYRQNETWWRRIKTGEYLRYYEEQYDRR